MIDTLKQITPEPLKRLALPVYNRFKKKYTSELEFWKGRYRIDGGTFSNDHFERVMLGMSERDDDQFLSGKIVADFGCGPRGSLRWAKSAAVRIGIDVLADVYVDEFIELPHQHGMVYLKSTEKVVPLPDNFVDVMYSLNAIDHVDDFEQMCDEVIRVLKPKGELICSFNMEEPPSVCEPNQLSEKLVKECLLSKLDLVSYRITRKGPPEDQYKPFFDGAELSYQPGEEGYLWLRARKRSA